MEKYFTIPVNIKKGQATLVLDEKIVEKLNLGESREIYACFTEHGLEFQKMVSVDLEIDKDILYMLSELAKKQNRTMDEIFAETLAKIGFNK